MDCHSKASVIAKDVGYLPSENSYYENMKVRELLQYTADLYGMDCKTKMKELADRLNLDLSRKIADLSLGNKKKVGIVSAIMTSPKLIIMDEPTSGLDPLIQQAFYDILKEENSRGATVFFSSHVLSEVQKLCDRVAILKEGQLIGIQSIKELRESGYKKVSLSAKEAIPRDFFLAISLICPALPTMRRLRIRPLFPLCITEISRPSLIKSTCFLWTMCFWKSPLWKRSSCTTMNKGGVRHGHF